MAVILLVLLVGVTTAQLHHHGAGVTCYDCGGHGHNFPDCLNHARQCHHDEACMISYGGHGPAHEHGPEVRCHKLHECHSHVVDDSTDSCPAGGQKVEGPEGGCKLCCEDDACITDTINKVNELITVAAAKQVQCPDHCPPGDLASCLTSAHRCHGDQYCMVSKDEGSGVMHGRCDEMMHIQHCRDQVADSHCDPHHHHCTVGCCADSGCISGFYGGGASSSQPPPDTTPSGDGLNTLTCGDLQGLNCAVLDSICTKVSCPDICGPCFDSIVTAPASTMSPVITDAVPATDLPAQPVTDDVPVETSMLPADTAPPSVMEATSMVPADTTMAPMMGDTSMAPAGAGPDAGSDAATGVANVSGTPASSVTSDPSCVDTIQNMQCSDVEDVCSSPLLVSFCQKHCGLCC